MIKLTFLRCSKWALPWKSWPFEQTYLVASWSQHRLSSILWKTGFGKDKKNLTPGLQTCHMKTLRKCFEAEVFPPGWCEVSEENCKKNYRFQLRTPTLQALISPAFRLQLLHIQLCGLSPLGGLLNIVFFKQTRDPFNNFKTITDSKTLGERIQIIFTTDIQHSNT